MRNHNQKNVSCCGTARPALLRVGDSRDPVLRIDDPNARKQRGLCIRPNGRVAIVSLEACCADSWGKLPDDELLSMYQSVLAYHSLVEVSLIYRNHCWKCKTSIDGSRDYRCEACHWYLCSACGECGCDYKGPVERDPQRHREIQELKDGRQRCVSVLNVLKLHMCEREMSFVN